MSPQRPYANHNFRFPTSSLCIFTILWALLVLPNGIECLNKTQTTTPSETQSRTPTPTLTVSQFPDGSCLYETGFDYVSNDLPVGFVAQTATASDCCAYCSSRSSWAGCLFWSWNETDQMCYPKFSKIGRKAGTKIVSGSVISPAFESCQVEGNINYEGWGLVGGANVTTNATTVQECCGYCSSLPDCVYFTWDVTTKLCYPKYSKMGRKTATAMISGTSKQYNQMQGFFATINLWAPCGLWQTGLILVASGKSLNLSYDCAPPSVAGGMGLFRLNGTLIMADGSTLILHQKSAQTSTSSFQKFHPLQTNMILTNQTVIKSLILAGAVKVQISPADQSRIFRLIVQNGIQMTTTQKFAFSSCPCGTCSISAQSSTVLVFNQTCIPPPSPKIVTGGGDDSSGSLGWVAAPVVCGVAAVVLALLGYWWWNKKKEEKRQMEAAKLAAERASHLPPGVPTQGAAAGPIDRTRDPPLEPARPIALPVAIPSPVHIPYTPTIFPTQPVPAPTPSGVFPEQGVVDGTVAMKLSEDQLGPFQGVYTLWSEFQSKPHPVYEY